MEYKKLLKKYLIDEDDYDDEYKYETKDEKIVNKETIDSKKEFLIYRPMQQQNQRDIGWYVLRELSDEKMNELMNTINDDEIVCYFGRIDTSHEHNTQKMNMDGPENNGFISIYVTKTNIGYQLEKKFKPTNVFDKILYDSERCYFEKLIV